MILLYKRGATGLTGRLLARLLGSRAWDGDKATPRVYTAVKDGVVIRWGNDMALAAAKREINNRQAVALARNKHKALEAMASAKVRVPPFVEGWARKCGAIGRSLYHQGGEGLRVFQAGESLTGCAYYIDLIPSIDEFRVHVVNNKVVATQRKVHLNGTSADPIRNYNNGWRFVRIQERPWLTKHAIPAVQALGLDFGAVDIVRSTDHHMYVLEVNTAPGLEGTMPERYAEALKELLLVEAI